MSPTAQDKTVNHLPSRHCGIMTSDSHFFEHGGNFFVALLTDKVLSSE